MREMAASNLCKAWRGIILSGERSDNQDWFGVNKRSASTLKETRGARRGTSLSVTQRSVPQAAAEEGSHRLSDKIAALEAEIALYRTALENSRSEMQAFAYSVSHDLRAPLRAIEGFSKILVDDFASELSPEAKRFLKHIASNTEVLGSQIEDLLRFYRIGKTAPARVSASADALCREAMAAFPPHEAEKIKVASPLPEVFADPVKLREAFSELLANAIKFTKGTAEPRIEVRAEREANATRFTISDNGVGFDPQYAGKLFQVFQKLHPASEFRGNGIGLAIVKRVVQAHGGYVEAKGFPLEGATFSFTLPQGEPVR